MTKEQPPAVDPTRNVIALIKMVDQRQNDLRELTMRRNDDLRAAETRRTDDLRRVESKRLHEMAAVRTKFNDKLVKAEANRINAIRAVDVNAVAVASQRASDQATVLATQVVQSAEALRVLVASTAATVATSQQQLATALSSRITTLEQAGYQAQGKSTYSDPMLTEVAEGLRSLRESRASGMGKSSGFSSSWGLLLGVVTLVVALLAIGSFVMSVQRTPGAPQIIYVPTAPAPLGKP